MILGITATATSFATLFISSVAYFMYYLRQEESMLKVARIGFYTASLLIVFQSVLLMWGILTHQFQWSYVFSYSSTDLTLYYLISTFWAGQEGTFMLWLFMGVLYGTFIVRKYKEEEPLVMGFMNLVHSFILMILVKKNPFTYVWQVNPAGFVPGMTPADGNGLNPLLQDPWMTIHPPILFLGYSSTVILFAFAMSALIRQNYDNWIKPVYPFVLFVGVTLGTGIILGGYWAYTTLGWGGFWGWDPVENSSLIPWITSLALIHGILIQRKQGGVKKTNIFLALLTFILVLYGSFLTRSGVLTDFSVHSFGASELNLYLSGFVILFFSIALITFALRINEVKGERVQAELLSKESFTLFGVLLLIIFAVLTFVGTSSPILTGLVGKAKNVSTEYYNTLAGPLAILMALLIGLTPVLVWKRSSAEKFKPLIWHIGISIILGIITYLLGMQDIIPLIITVFSYFLILVNLQAIFKMWRSGNFQFGGHLTHFGLGLMFIGIITSSVYDSSEKVTLPLGTPITVLGHEIEFQGKIPSQDNRDMVKIGIDGKTRLGKYYWSEYSRAYMIGPAVRNTILRDLYVSPIQIFTDDQQSKDRHEVVLTKGTPVESAGFTLLFEKYEMGGHGMEAGDVQVTAVIKVMDDAGKLIETIRPSLKMNGKKRDLQPADLPDGKHQALIQGINVESGAIKLVLVGADKKDSIYAGKELLAAEVSVKPLINLLWLGTVILVIGFILAMIAQRKKATA